MNLTLSEAHSRPVIERRVLRACQTIRALPDPEKRFLYGSLEPGCWREAMREWDAYAAQEVIVRFVPTPFDVSDFLEALSWCRCLDKPEWRLVWSRSFPNVSFSMMAARIGRSDETARKHYYAAIDKVWHHFLGKLTEKQ